jgi:K+-transporting ATPase ATPase C chain
MNTACRFSILLFILCGVVYPLVMTGLGQWLFPYQANGSLIHNQRGLVMGSTLLGQPFTQPRYFHPRPSANQYDAANSGGSNYGATNTKLIERVKTESAQYRHDNQTAHIPLDAITTSASSLDPHISIKNAWLQVPRIATARGLPPQKITLLIQREATANCDWAAQVTQSCGIVNVVKLNRLLDNEGRTNAR